MAKCAGWEDYLIPIEKWQGLYNEMPDPCKAIVDDPENDCVGIGQHPDWGWFTACSGQGPSVMWREKDV